jgi:alanyl-tRNA synthetase
MRSTDIRQTFFDFFGERDHRRVPSGSLIPDDPSLLLTNAGMVPFKSYFQGRAVPEHPRLMSLQKCAHRRHRQDRPYRAARDVVRDAG